MWWIGRILTGDRAVGITGQHDPIPMLMEEYTSWQITFDQPEHHSQLQT